MTTLQNFQSRNFTGDQLLMFSSVVGGKLVTLSIMFEINNQISPAAVPNLEFMARSGVIEVTSGVTSLAEIELFTVASGVVSPTEVET